MMSVFSILFAVWANRCLRGQKRVQKSFDPCKIKVHIQLNLKRLCDKILCAHLLPSQPSGAVNWVAAH